MTNTITLIDALNLKGYISTGVHFEDSIFYTIVDQQGNTVGEFPCSVSSCTDHHNDRLEDHAGKLPEVGDIIKVTEIDVCPMMDRYYRNEYFMEVTL
jgi:hypothetical protein